MVNISKYYKDVDLNARVLSAQPHEITTMLFDRLQSDLRITRIAIENGEVASKCRHLSNAIDIISHLNSTLNTEANAQLCEKLSATYEFLSVQLVAVNAFDDLKKLDECEHTLAKIVTWWTKTIDIFENQHNE